MLTTTVRGNLDHTIAEIIRISTVYRLDVIDFARFSFGEMHRYVADFIPYVKDPRGIELLKRPLFTLEGGGDCDCKTIVQLAHAMLKPTLDGFDGFGFALTGTGGFSHIFFTLYFDGKRIDVDATYPGNEIDRTSDYDTRKDYRLK